MVRYMGYNISLSKFKLYPFTVSVIGWFLVSNLKSLLTVSSWNHAKWKAYFIGRAISHKLASNTNLLFNCLFCTIPCIFYKPVRSHFGNLISKKLSPSSMLNYLPKSGWNMTSLNQGLSLIYCINSKYVHFMRIRIKCNHDPRHALSTLDFCYTQKYHTQ